MFAAAGTLSSKYKSSGDRIAIVTNAGGPAVLAADHAPEVGLTLADLSEDTIKALNEVLPATWSHRNPVDIIGDAPPERYREAIDICLKDSEVDGVLVILTPQAMTARWRLQRQWSAAAESNRKPIITSWMGGKQVNPARSVFRQARIPTFNTPEAAIDAFHYLASYKANQALLLQTPGRLPLEHDEPNIEAARLIIESRTKREARRADGTRVDRVARSIPDPNSTQRYRPFPEEALVLGRFDGLPRRDEDLFRGHLAQVRCWWGQAQHPQRC